jgi:hypothetical protein
MNAGFCCPRCNTALGTPDDPQPIPLRVRLEAGPTANRLRLDYGAGGVPESHRLGRFEIRAAADPGLPWAQWRSVNGTIGFSAGEAAVEEPLSADPAQFYRALELP